MLTVEGCKNRRERFLKIVADQKLDWILLSDPRHVYYVSGFLPDARFPSYLLLGVQSGASARITCNPPKHHELDEVVEYPSRAFTLVRQDLVSSAAQTTATWLKDHIKGRSIRFGIEDETAAQVMVAMLVEWSQRAEFVDVSNELREMRRCKDADEVALLRRSVACCERAYAAAKAAIAPGKTELDIYGVMADAVTQEAGYAIPFAGDFVCGLRALKTGGTPVPNELLSGDLYILDFFPIYRGYWSDMCRTFAVTTVSDLQQQAWEIVAGALRWVEENVKPGMACVEVYAALKEQLDAFEPARGSFSHHAGHGIGLDGHEKPWLIPDSEDVFEEGNVFTAEPGLYSPDLQGGLRLENNYIVTVTGVERLGSFPLEYK